MYGAITGDIVGSIYEFSNNRTKDFELFGEGCDFTDDTVLTVAVEKWLTGYKSVDELNEDVLVAIMQNFGQRYEDRGYGGRFSSWIWDILPHPYNSWGNGSAMRASGTGWFGNTIEDVRRVAKMSAEVTHNHPEGIKGAEATAAAIFMARTGSSKKNIKQYIEQEFEYDLSMTCDEIRPTYKFNESCQETVPQAIIAFLESTDFEDAIRNGISLGGDSDTLTCITGGIAEAFYGGVPEPILKKVKELLPNEFIEIVDKFYI
jgi:ADP-ribosyl-[dinitrogen reductase] hydrolase